MSFSGGSIRLLTGISTLALSTTLNTGWVTITCIENPNEKYLNSERKNVGMTTRITKETGPEPSLLTRHAEFETVKTDIALASAQNCVVKQSEEPILTQRMNVAIWELPDILLYHVGQFISPPTERASFFCNKIALLCKESYRSIMEESKGAGLWDLILKGDYGIVRSNDDKRRSSKRLKRSLTHKVRDTHKAVIYNTEAAYSELWELSYSSKKNSLTKQKLIDILNRFGPVMVDRKMASGGTFMVEICRCRNATPNMVLNCVRELVERRGALVNIKANDSKSSSLTALCVASVRGMHKVVEYLLSNGGVASTNIRCSGKFRLYKNR